MRIKHQRQRRYALPCLHAGVPDQEMWKRLWRQKAHHDWVSSLVHCPEVRGACPQPGRQHHRARTCLNWSLNVTWMADPHSNTPTSHTYHPYGSCRWAWSWPPAWTSRPASPTLSRDPTAATCKVWAPALGTRRWASAGHGTLGRREASVCFHVLHARCCASTGVPCI